MTDWPRLHEEALRDLDGLVSWAGVSDLDRPTPCAGWDLGRLVSHLAGQHHGFAVAIATGRSERADYAEPALVDDDWRVTVWRRSIDALATAVAAADLDGTAVLAELSPTHRFPVADAIAFQFVDTVAHCWDVATALGVSFRPSDPLVAAFLAESRRVPDGDARTTPGAAFGPVVDATDDPWGEALGLLGRDLVSVSGRSEASR